MNASNSKYAVGFLSLLMSCVVARQVFSADAPTGRLEEMTATSDLVFKGRVISSSPVTNASFPYWGNHHATKFDMISVIKGNVETNVVVFHHITKGPDAWGGGTPPSHFIFEAGQSYIIFAANADKPDWLYSPSSNNVAKPDEFRQPMKGEYAMRTLNARPLENLTIKDAHWIELNQLLNDSNPTNQLYAIDLLDHMSLAGRRDDEWPRSDDFKREVVLKTVLPLITNSHDQVSVSAIGCFEVGGSHIELFGGLGGGKDDWMPIIRGCSDVKPECIASVAPYANALIAVANSASSSLRRVAAIAALSCTRFPSISNSLPHWLADSDADVRAQAVLLLPDFPGEYCDRALRERAADSSPTVRAAVADAIGNGKIEALLPTLGILFSNSPTQTNSGPMPHKGLQGDGYFAEIGSDDIHTSAGYALLKFDLNQVGAILKANLSDEGFGLRFIRKLAQNGVEPYIPLLAKELKTHTADSEKVAAANGFHWSLSYWLTGNDGWAWDTLFGYVSVQTREALADSQIAPMLDALQIADDPGDARTRSLYGFFLDKGMINRAKELRRGIIRRTEDKAIDKKSFGFPEKLKAFDEMDEKHSLKPGLGL
jgi:hypothetical protein